jgi:hypothetical protein
MRAKVTIKPTDWINIDLVIYNLLDLLCFISLQILKTSLNFYDAWKDLITIQLFYNFVKYGKIFVCSICVQAMLPFISPITTP